jgi:hypothetical protein
MEWIAIASFIISVVSGPIVMAAVGAVHERKTQKLITDALKEEQVTMTATHERSAAKLIEEALGKERERARELFALKHEVAEMKGHVMQLVTNTSALDAKLDKMSDLLMELRRSR